MRLLVVLSILSLGIETHLPAPVVLPYAFYPGLLSYPYSVPVLPDILHSGLHYPLAKAYVHDDTADVAEFAAPDAEAYAHDVSGDVSDDAYPAAEAYVHDVAGDVVE